MQWSPPSQVLLIYVHALFLNENVYRFCSIPLRSDVHHIQSIVILNGSVCPMIYQCLYRCEVPSERCEM